MLEKEKSEAFSDVVNMQELIDAGVHFGHRANKGNPKNARFLVREGDIHLINLDFTVPALLEAMDKICSVVANYGSLLFVGTGIASVHVKSLAERCGQPCFAYKWPGGALTNYPSILGAIKKLESLENAIAGAQYRTKKEKLTLERELNRKLRCFDGARNMKKIPDLVIIFSAKTDGLAIKEAKIVGIPSIAICDSDSDSDGVNIVIPGNDDLEKSITYFCRCFAIAVFAGLNLRQNKEQAQLVRG